MLPNGGVKHFCSHGCVTKTGKTKSFLSTSTWFSHYSTSHPSVNICVIVNDLAEAPLMIDEFLNEDAEDDDEETNSSSGSSVDVVIESQLSNIDVEMITVNPIDGFVLINPEGEFNHYAPRRRGPFILDTP
jgi:hypothetical protein